jgi:hypothetical protein
VILVISHPADDHATRVVGLLRAGGHEVHLIDLSDLPARATLSIGYQPDPRMPTLEYRLDGEPIDLGRTRAVWWRRPQVADPSAIMDTNARLFAGSEWSEAVNGLWELLDGARWMNPPGADEAASRKARQLRVAAEVGLAVPRTLLTSDPERARAFVEAAPGRTIFKTFAATPTVWRETRLVGEAELAALESVRLAPVIFQDFVEADADLRVTVVGERIFTIAIDATATDYPVDFRMSLGQARVEAIELPAEVVGRLRALMARLGLVYGAIDLRRTPDGEHVFLEVNTAGEFLFVEERTGQPISRSVADWLAA